MMAERETDHVELSSPAGPLLCSGTGPEAVTVDMGEPHLDWREIPMSQAVDTASFALDVPGLNEEALKTAMAVSVDPVYRE